MKYLYNSTYKDNEMKYNEVCVSIRNRLRIKFVSGILERAKTVIEQRGWVIENCIEGNVLAEDSICIVCVRMWCVCVYIIIYT